MDQIAEVVRLLREDPDSRRIVVSAWNVAELPQMAVTACHAFFQFYVSAAPRRRGARPPQLPALSAKRGCVPRRAVQHRKLRVLPTCSRQCDLDVGELIWTGGDCHVYDNHREQIETQLARDPYPYPSLVLRRRPASIFEYAFEDFEVVDYEHHPAIRAPVAV